MNEFIAVQLPFRVSMERVVYRESLRTIKSVVYEIVLNYQGVSAIAWMEEEEEEASTDRHSGWSCGGHKLPSQFHE